MPKLRLCLGVFTAALFAANAAHAQDQLLQTHITRLGSDPSLFRTVNATVGPITNSDSAPFTTDNISADYGLLKVDVTGVMPATGTSSSVSISTYGKWIDTFSFAPSNTSLNGTFATAHFDFAFFGNIAYHMDSSADGSTVSYDLDVNGEELQGHDAVNNPVAGGISDISSLSSIGFDQGFNLGTPFTLNIFLSDGISLQNTTAGPSNATLNLTLASTGLEIFDNDHNPIAGVWTSNSGHDYTVSAIPEPATWALVPGLLGLVAIWRRKQSAA